MNGERINLTIPKELAKDIKQYLKDYKYVNAPEFVREAIREKLYGKTLKEHLSNKFLEEIENEKEFNFKKNKEIYNKLKKIAKNI